MEIIETIVEEVPGYLQVYADGTVARYDHRLTRPNPEYVDGAKSKDVVVDPSKGIRARLFLPEVAADTEKLPLVFYFHGGGFCIGSTAWALFHAFLTGLSARARVLVVSVDYRLAPEHRLPTAYDDCFDAVDWVRRQADHDPADPWLQSHADYSRCYLAGESAGGNIAHVVGTRAAGRDMGMLKIRGLVVIHPYFGSEERIECEKVGDDGSDDAIALEYNDLFWRLAIPVGFDRDHPACNPRAPGAPNLCDVPLPPVLVTVAGLDMLKQRGVLYFELLKSCGKEAELMVAEDQVHAFHIFHPQSEAARLLQDRISEFIRRL